MNLYKLTREDFDYGDYKGMIVAAETVEEALEMHPSPFVKSFTEGLMRGKLGNTWANDKQDIKIELIGVSDSKVKKVIFAA